MKYISCFSGIGGLEASWAPEVTCEIDPEVREILKNRYPSSKHWDDISTLKPPSAEIVAGGWPCQDISIAGQQAGLAGARSGLLTELIRVATGSGAHSIVAENVPNLLRMRNGSEFEHSLKCFSDAGYRYIGWRTLNAREFGLPQNRSRLIIVASRDPKFVSPLFRPIVSAEPTTNLEELRHAAGFYWTAGTHSINYTIGYVPAIKIGSSLGIASPPAVHYGEVVRLLTASEALALQGFELTEADFPSRASAFRAAGNAVARPIGTWVFDGVADAESIPKPLFDFQSDLFGGAKDISRYANVGFFDGREIATVEVAKAQRASNLESFLDLDSTERLSIRAASGLLRRLENSRQTCPNALKAVLLELTHGRA